MLGIHFFLFCFFISCFFFINTLTRKQALATHLPQAERLMKFYANSQKRFPRLSGRPRQTEHVTTPALPSASSFSCQCSLIAEVIRLGKAVLKINVSHVSHHFCLDGCKAFEGNIHRGQQSTALSSPSACSSLLLLLQGEWH